VKQISVSGADLTHDRVDRLVADVQRAAEPLLLLIGEENRLSAELQRLHSVTGSPLLAVSQQLGLRLLEQTPHARLRAVVPAFREILQPYLGTLTLLDRTALLFLPDLCLNPLQLLLEASRGHGPLIVAWAGAWEDPVLTYAFPGHREYRRYQHPSALIAPL